MEKKAKPVSKPQKTPAAPSPGWVAPQNTSVPKQRAMDRKPIGRGAVRGR